MAEHSIQMLNYPLTVIFGEQTVIEFKVKSQLPLKKSVQLKSPNIGNTITVVQQDIMQSYTFMPSRNMLLTCKVDTNSEYTIKCYDLSNGQSEKIPLKRINTKVIFKEKTSYSFPRKILKNDKKIDAVGIDWGNTSCYVAVNRNNGIETVPLGNKGERMLSSYVSYDLHHENFSTTKCGQIVIKRLRWDSKASVFGIKHLIGKHREDINIDSNWSFKILDKNSKFKVSFQSNSGENSKYPEEISAEILEYMKTKTEEFQGNKLKEVVITIPVNFDDKQKEATRVAALLAGWKTVYLLPDPIAAIFAYFADKPIPNIFSTLLFDFGGGSLNVYIIEIHDEHIEIINHCYETNICGTSFDELLFNYFVRELDEKYGITELGEKKYNLLLKCQEIKHTLSADSEASLDVDDISPSDDDQYRGILTTQNEFEQMADKLLDKIKQTIVLLLKEAKYKTEWISNVIMVGGGCRMSMIQKLLRRIFSHAVHYCDKQPDEVLAIGAALYAYQLKTSLIPSSPQYYVPKNLKVETKKSDVVGIDFGTSTCSVAVSRREGIETVPLDNMGERTLPPYIAYNEKNEIIGQIVINRLKYNSTSSVYDMKCIMGKNFGDVKTSKNWSFTLTQAKKDDTHSKFEIIEDTNTLIEIEAQLKKALKSPEEISAELLKFMKKKTEEFQGKRLNDVVISVPMGFNDKQKEATRVAALLAGWKIVHLLPDPIAAIFAYFADKPMPRNNLNILTFDLGGSTLDICIFNIQDNKIRLLSRSGDANFGGKNFDKVLADNVKNTLRKEFNISLLEDVQHQLNSACNRIKKDLCYYNEKKYCYEDLEKEIEIETLITRKQLKELSSNLLNMIQIKIQDALSNISFEYHQIDMVLQIGGGCRMPMIKKLLRKSFPTAQHCCHSFPEEIVAFGAAVYAYNLRFASEYSVPDPISHHS